MIRSVQCRRDRRRHDFLRLTGDPEPEPQALAKRLGDGGSRTGDRRTIGDAVDSCRGCCPGSKSYSGQLESVRRDFHDADSPRASRAAMSVTQTWWSLP